MKFTIVRNVTTPKRAHDNDAGIDFFVPTFDEDFLKDLHNKNPESIDKYYVLGGKLSIYPKADVLIPSGIKCELPVNTALIAFNKSGVATKKKLVVGAATVDEGYRGEIHIHLINTSINEVIIEEGDKIVQFVLIPVIYEKLELVSNEEFNTNTERCDGGFGSTGK